MERKFRHVISTVAIESYEKTGEGRGNRSKF